MWARFYRFLQSNIAENSCSLRRSSPVRTASGRSVDGGDPGETQRIKKLIGILTRHFPQRNKGGFIWLSTSPSLPSRSSIELTGGGRKSVQQNDRRRVIRASFSVENANAIDGHAMIRRRRRSGLHWSGLRSMASDQRGQSRKKMP
jgi:hypothetical protein